MLDTRRDELFAIDMGVVASNTKLHVTLITWATLEPHMRFAQIRFLYKLPSRRDTIFFSFAENFSVSPGRRFVMN